MRLCILGAGAWGSALAIHFSTYHDVMLWARDAAHVATMRSQRTNTRYLPGIAFPDALRLTEDLRACVDHADAVLVAVPSTGFRALLTQIAPWLGMTPLIWACKGFEPGSMLLPHQVAEQTLDLATPRGVLSGPSFASEVARGLPTALTLASDSAATRDLATQLHHQHLRVYTSDDVIGVEIGGALKNVMAIAAGISDGLALGHNARAALIARGLAEISRLGILLGGHPETFMGLTGMGDLILTATSDQSRNRQVGLRLATGASLTHILDELGHVAEGVHTAHEVARLARTLDVEMPIVTAVDQVLHERLPARKAVDALLNREPRAEWHH